jgi:hypothetical protein
MNKKAQASDMKRMLIQVALIFVGIAAVFMVLKYTNMFDFDKNSFKGDFDGDNKENTYGSDMFDPCPCGTDNVKQQTASGLFCVASYTPAQCECANKIANIARKKDLDIKTDVALFISDGSGKCLYDKEDACKYLIMQNERFNSDLLAAKGACPGETPK